MFVLRLVPLTLSRTDNDSRGPLDWHQVTGRIPPRNIGTCVDQHPTPNSPRTRYSRDSFSAHCQYVGSGLGGLGGMICLWLVIPEPMLNRD